MVVPESILASHSAYHLALMEEDLARRGSALAELREAADNLPGDCSGAWFRERIERFRAACRERGAVARPDARALHCTNLALAALFMGLRTRSDPQGRYDPRQVRVFINSQLKEGSEMVGLLATDALASLGFEVRACIPRKNVYPGMDESDLDAWLESRGLPGTVRAPYGMGQGCLEMAEEEALAKAAGLSAWLDEQRVGVVIGSAFIAELPLGPPSDRLVYLGLYQPTGTCPNELTFLRDRMHGLFSDSRWSTRQWARWMAPPVHWVPYAVSAEHFGPRRTATVGTVRIAVGGTLNDRKRQIEALQAVKLLVSEGHDLHVNFYGYEVDKDYVRQVKNLAQEPSLQGRVAFHGLVDAAVLARDNDILLIASRDEGLPQTALFGMAGGLLCVACPCGGIAEVVRNGETGFLARGFAVADICQAVGQCLTERNRWPELVARARALLVEGYSEPIAVNRLLRFLLDGATIAASPGRNRFPVAGNRQASPGSARSGHPWQLAAHRTLWSGPEVGRRGVRYRLRCEEDHLSGLQWCLNVSLGKSRGTLRLTVRAEPSGTVMRQAELDLVSSLGREWVQVRFPPIADSAGRDFSVLATTDLTEGRCVFFEAWPHPLSRPRLLASRIHKRLGNYLGIGLSRGVSPFFPVYGPAPHATPTPLAGSAADPEPQPDDPRR